MKSVHEGVDENGGRAEGEQIDECICTLQCTVYCTRIERAIAVNNIKYCPEWQWQWSRTCGDELFQKAYSFKHSEIIFKGQRYF